MGCAQTAALSRAAVAVMAWRSMFGMVSSRSVVVMMSHLALVTQGQVGWRIIRRRRESRVTAFQSPEALDARRSKVWRS